MNIFFDKDEYHDSCIKSLTEKLAAEKAEKSRLLSDKNAAYSERDRLVHALSKVFPAWLERHPDSDTKWEDEWRWIVFIDFPTGQGSWHIHVSELPWFDHLERREGNSWDGHTTEQKYERVFMLGPIAEQFKSTLNRAKYTINALDAIIVGEVSSGWAEHFAVDWNDMEETKELIDSF